MQRDMSGFCATQKSQTYVVASTPAITGSVSCQDLHFFSMNEGIRIRRAKCFLCTYLISGFGTMFEQCNTWSKCSSIIHTVSGTKFFLSIKFVRIYSKNILLGSGYRGVGPTWPQLLPGDLWAGVRAPRGDSQGGEQGEEEERPGNTMHHRSSRPSP